MRTIIILPLFMAILAVATAFHCDSGEYVSDSVKCDGYADCECGCDEHGCDTQCVGGNAEGCYDNVTGNPTGKVNWNPTGSSFVNKLLATGGSSGNNRGGYRGSSGNNRGGYRGSSGSNAGGSRTNSYNRNNGGSSSSRGSCKNLDPDCDEWQKDVHCESGRYMDNTAVNRRKGIAGMQMIKVCARSCNNCGGGGSRNNGGGSRTNSYNRNNGGSSRGISGGNRQYGGNSGGRGGGSFGGNRRGGGQAPSCGKRQGNHFEINGCSYECDGNISGSGTCATQKSGTCGSCFGQDWGGACSGEPRGCSSCKTVC